MSDLINRQEALKQSYWLGIDGSFYLVIDAEDLCRLPSAEPQIIRCKDCKYFQIDGNFMFCNSEGSMFADVTKNDYCSYAERREEE